MGASVFLLLLLLIVAGFVALLVGVLNQSKRAKAEEAPPPLARLSALSVLSFLTGLGALLAALAALVCTWSVRYRYVLGFGDGEVYDLQLGAQILSYATLLPAVAAVAFAIAARGAVRESRGELRGRSLYHTAVLVALLSSAGVWALLA